MSILNKLIHISFLPYFLTVFMVVTTHQEANASTVPTDGNTSCYSDLDDDTRKRIEDDDKKQFRLLSKGAEVSFINQVKDKNTIYEIRDVFDLGGATVTIPEGCVLRFLGGRITNGTIIGNRTSIQAPDIQIFSYDRTRYCIKGTWNIDAWKTIWFGTIDDGKAMMDKSTYEMKFSGTDNYQSIQSALDVAYITNCKRVIIGRGCFRISKGLNVGWGNEVTMTFECPESYHSGTWVTDGNLVPAQLLYDGEGYAINITGGYNTIIKGISIIGKSGSVYRKNEEGLYHKYDVIDRNTNEPNIRLFSSSAVNSMKGAYSQYHPYAGIVTDAYVDYKSSDGYKLPEFPAYLTKGFSGSPIPSKRVVLDAVTIAGFVVGYGISLGHGVTMNEYMKVYNSHFLSNVYAVAICTRNGRNTAFRDCYFNGNFCGITNRYFGEVHMSNSPGVGYAIVDNCSFDHSFEVVDYNNEGKYILFKNCSAEYLYHIGRTASLFTKYSELKFEDCYFITKHNPTEGSGIPFTFFRGAAIFTRCTIKDYTDTQDEKAAPNPGIVPLLMNQGAINMCTFTSSDRGLLYSASSPLVLLNSALCSVAGPEPIESSLYGIGTTSLPVLNRRSFTDCRGNVRSTGFTDIMLAATISNGMFNQSFDNKKGELTITFNGYAHKVNVAPGDIIYNYSMNTSFAGTAFTIVQVNTSDISRVKIIARPITGYIFNKGKYTLNNHNINKQPSSNWEQGRWYVSSVRNVELYDYISVVKVDGNKFQAHSDISSVIKAGDSFSTYSDFDFAKNIITGVEAKTIYFDEVIKDLVPGYELCWVRKNYLDSRFWYHFNEKGQPSSKMQIQNIIDSDYSCSLTVNASIGGKVIIVDLLGVSYGSIDKDGKRHTVLLPKNTYKIIDSKTNRLIDLIELDKDKSISI